MKKRWMIVVPALAGLLLAAAVIAAAESVTVWDWGNSEYRNYDVTQDGGRVTIYDYQRNAYIDGQVDSRGNATYYDYGTNSFYDVNRTGQNSWSGYDYNTNTFQDYTATPDGGVDVYDYGGGGWRRVDPVP
jgi:hypothetical protein